MPNNSENFPQDEHLRKCYEKIQESFEEIFKAAEQKDLEKKVYSEDDAIWERIGAFLRILQQQFPDKHIHTILGGIPEESFDGISVVMGGTNNNLLKEPFINTWIEVRQADQTLLVGMEKLSDCTYKLKSGIYQSESIENARDLLGFRPMTTEAMLDEGILLGPGYQYRSRGHYLSKLSYYIDYAEAHRLNFIMLRTDMLELIPYCNIDLEHPKIKQAMEFVNNGDIPRNERINLALEMRDSQIKQGIQRELEMMSPEIKNAYGLDGSILAWDKYLETRYQEFIRETENRSNFTFEDFVHNYIYLMLDYQAEILDNEIFDRIAPTGTVYKSFHESGFDMVKIIWQGNPVNELDYEPPTDSLDRRQFDGDSLITHTISEQFLHLAMADGFVGASGTGRVCTSQDRITNGGRGYVVIWRVQDILDAGYPLYYVAEDFRDAEVLRELRSYALPLALAVKIDYLFNVPDIRQAEGAQIHHPNQYAGVSYLNKIRETLKE